MINNMRLCGTDPFSAVKRRCELNNCLGEALVQCIKFIIAGKLQRAFGSRGWRVMDSGCVVAFDAPEESANSRSVSFLRGPEESSGAPSNSVE
jgi:hypothetical protein